MAREGNPAAMFPTLLPDRLLVLDTPTRDLWSLAARLRVDGFAVVEVSAAPDALAEVGRGLGALLVHPGADVDLPAVLAVARGDDPDVAVMAIVDITAAGPLPAALVDAAPIHLPAEMGALSRRIAREIAGARTRRHLRAFQRSLGPRLDVDALIGEAEPMARVRTQLQKLSGADGVPVLVSGEWGTGHGLVARIAHDMSDRWPRPFVHVDCTTGGVLPVAGLGIERGQGVTAWVDEATTYLEHVERLTPSLQVALLQVLETGHAAGSAFDRSRRGSVVASTTVDLSVEVDQGRFRRDLYYRLNVARIDLPPLRHRGPDVLRLAAHFAAVEGMALRRRPAWIDDAARHRLTAYGWPGNVRELRQVIARAVLLSDGDAVTIESLASIDPAMRPRSGPVRLPDEGLSLDALERQFVVEALERTGGNQSRAAELLGLHRDQVRYRMRKYGLGR